ncbi:heterogeneous nuclear ribonucleoprotein U-like protein 2 [Panicum hallii]|uniref:heterogeneous nuclear ribonucleoprotein U-like protein 2 n=1 Tax=Panicum hallii TaxID=206008 RepID=UPI000DF4E5B8|nr:heterogeneous nuclear ribonucleoprotein U-like protein 2 [Panicum hallii]
MELPEDHPDAAGDSNKDTAGGDGANPGAAGEDDAEDGDDDPAAPDGGDEDPDDDPEPADAADKPPSEPHYEKQIHRLDFAEGGQEEAEDDAQGEGDSGSSAKGDQDLPPEYDNDESIKYLTESPSRKRVHYKEPGYRTRYR